LVRRIQSGAERSCDLDRCCHSFLLLKRKQYLYQFDGNWAIDGIRVIGRIQAFIGFCSFHGIWVLTIRNHSVYDGICVTGRMRVNTWTWAFEGSWAFCHSQPPAASHRQPSSDDANLHASCIVYCARVVSIAGPGRVIGDHSMLSSEPTKNACRRST
jgi:hypothetical protein